ncbi:unnamed protein product, partial [marine sediment metagenome]
MEKTEETTYGYSVEIQKKIVAMMLFDKAAFVENLEIIRPEYFDNPVLEALAKIIRKFYEKYHKVPTSDEFFQEADALIDSNKKLPRNDYADIIGEILTFGRLETFEYVKDLAREFAKFQAVRAALLESADTLQKSRDYGKINKSITDALLIGEKSDIPMSYKASDIEQRELKWLWKNYIPLGAITMFGGNPDAGKSWWMLNLCCKLSRGGTWFDGEPMGDPAGSYFMTYEDDAASILKKRIIQLGGDEDLINIHNTEHPIHTELSQPGAIERLERELIRIGNRRTLVIDPVIDFTGKTNPNAVQEVRAVLTPLAKMAKRQNL